MINDAFVIFLVQFLQISLGRIAGVIIFNLHGVGIYDNRAIVRITVKELSRIFDTEISPVLTQNGVRNNLRAVLHRRICLRVTL